MLSICPISAGSNAQEYYVDYATLSGEPHGEWWGQASAEFKLNDKKVTSEEMHSLLRGFSPDGKNALSQNSGDEHRGGWDLTFSAPKSVSIAWSTADDFLRKEIELAQKKAVHAGLGYIEKQGAIVRCGKGGVIKHEAHLIASLFEHGSNRAGEPQLHTHAIVFNVAKSKMDGKWRCPESRHIFDAQMAASAFYKAELSSNLLKLGFKVERTKDSFEIVGISKEVCSAQSTRSKEIKDALEKAGIDSESASVRAKETATLSTRNSKQDKPRDFARWREENAKNGFSYEDLKSIRSVPVEIDLTEEKQTKIIHLSTSRLTEHDSTFKKHQIYRALAENHIGLGGEKEIKSTLEIARKSDSFIKIGRGKKDEERFSTKGMITLESKIQEILEKRSNEGKHLVNDKTIRETLSKHQNLNPEQVKALKYIVSGKGGIAFIEGQAGTGKSTMLKAVKAAYEKNSFEMIGLSITNKAAVNLEEASGIRSRSVDSFLHASKDGRIKIDSRTIIVVDEAAMVGSKKTLELSQIAYKSKAKLVFVGDAKQIQPIHAGQAFEAQKSKSQMETLTTVFRQKNEWERNAIQNLRNGNTQSSLHEFEKRKLLHIGKDRTSTYEKIVSDWYADKIANPEKQTIMIATKNAEVSALNATARETLKRGNKLSDGIVLSTTHGVHEYSVNDKIIFTGNKKNIGIYNSVLGTIESVSKTRIVVRTENNKVVTFNPQEFDQFRHGYAITAHKSQGSTVDRAFVLVDGFNMDKEKFYVAMSRGRENNSIYCDKTSLRPLEFKMLKDLKNKPKEEQQKILTNHYIKELSSIVGTSHQKDSTQNYLSLSNAKRMVSTKLEKIFSQLKSLVATSQGKTQETTSASQSKQNVSSGNAQKNKNQSNESRGLGQS